MATANLSVPSDSATNPATICLLCVVGLGILFYVLYRYSKGPLYRPVIPNPPPEPDTGTQLTANCFSVRTESPMGTFNWVPIGDFARSGI